MITIICIALTIGIIAMFWWLIVDQQHKNFNRFLKEGDSVDWFRGEIRTKYTLEKNGAIWCEIRNPLTKHIRKVKRDQLLPNFWVTYKREV